MANVTSFGTQLAKIAAKSPDSIAAIHIDDEDNETSITYAELNRSANNLAHVLLARGVVSEDFVVVALPNCVEYYICLFAIWRLGACPAPLKADFTDWERKRYLAVVEPRLVIGDWADSAVDSLDMNALRGAIGTTGGELADKVPPRCWAIASGGSTGNPKLIVNLRPGIVERQYVQMDADVDRVKKNNPQPVAIVCAPLYHTHGLAMSVRSLLAGEKIILTNRFDAGQVVRLIEHYRVTLAALVATMLMRILRVPDLQARDLSSLSLVFSGAGKIPSTVAEAWIGIVGAKNFIVGYSASEGNGFTRIYGDELLLKPGSVGRGLDTDVRILDPMGRECAPEIVGEIFLRSRTGDQNVFEYRGAPPPPATPDGFTSVGDLGWLDADGYLYIADRRTDMVKTGGVNVYPAEVEAAIMENLAVADVAVIGLPDPEWGRRLHAVIVASDSHVPPSAAELTIFCKTRLAPQKIPKSFEFVDRLPRTDTLKINRSALAEARIRSDPISQPAAE